MARPGRSGWKLSSRLLLGDAALAGAGLALGTAPLWLYAALPGALGVAAGALALPLPVAGWAMLRLPFSSRPPGPEDGLLLTPADAPALFREIEQVRAQVGAPALDAVYLNSECNASIRQHRRLWGGTRNVLWLGLPLLELLSADACRAILAHECAHIAGRHGRYASRVYFARLQWQEAARQLARRKGLANAPLRLFMNWHVPRFLAASLDFARECEYQADAESARVCGVACASDALMATCLQGRALHEYASSLYADAAATEPPWLLVRLAEDGSLASPRDQAEAQIWLHQALCRPTSHDDTHPSLADRLAALKVPRALDERATPAPDAPGMPGARGMASTHSLPATSRPLPWRRAQPCAAQEWLQDQRLPLARALDDSRREAAAQALREAQDERREAVAAHHDLLRKQRLRALSADERARMAWHAAMLADDVDGAMKLLQENLRDHPGHVPSLCELATLLQRQNARPDAAPDANTTRGPDDARREPAQDAAEALWREAAAQPGPHRLACLRQLTAIALRRGDAGQALAWRTEADQLERRTLAEYTAAPRYEPHGLGEPELRRLADMLDPLLLAATGAWLLRDATSGHHVLLVLARESWILRAVGALTGEPSYLRRDCQALLQRLLPRVQRNIEPLLLAAGDPLPGVCTDATRLRRAGA